MDSLDFREILSRKPFSRVTSKGYLMQQTFTDGKEPADVRDDVTRIVVTQGDFLREYDPSGHAINNPMLYPDILKYDEEKKRYFSKPVTRCAFAFQRIIATKQIMHLCGNDIQFEIPKDEVDEDTQSMFAEFKKGWSEKNMEIHFYNAVKAYKVTGDVALVGYMKDGKFGCKVLSYLNGDTLYPHFNSLTGDIEVFARRYFDYDEEGSQKTEWVEVWDDKFLYRYKQGKSELDKAMNFVKRIFGMNGYELVSKKPHGFNFVPIAYHRDDNGACWSNSQDTIEQYEEAFSQFAENNKAYAFPIMYFKGDDVSIEGDMNGAVKAISMPSDADAGFLQRQDVSEAFNTELNVLYKMILSQSGCVEPPELKSGDLPGVAVKLLYTPAYERAFEDAQELNPFIDSMCRVFKAGYGMESGTFTQMMGLQVLAWIDPYIPQNLSELVTNLSACVQNKFLSRQTASERIPTYALNGEFKRLESEIKADKELDAAFEKQKVENDTEAKIRLSKATGKISTGGGSGRTRTTDENGNHPNEDNWSSWNSSH